MKSRIGINGFGRIGRNLFKIALTKENLNFEVVAINDLTDAETLAHLLRYDSIFGRFNAKIEVKKDSIVVNGREIKIICKKDPLNIPWKEEGVDIVIESTGVFTEKEKATKHMEAGAKKVIISAPGKNEDITIVMGVNHEKYDSRIHHIISNASCTTNCLAPIAKVLDASFGITKGLMSTTHSYTNDQKLLDLPHKDLRRARAATQSIIPTTTGAAEAVALVLPQLKGKLSGLAMRVPTPTVSVLDLVCVLNKSTNAEEINRIFKESASGELKGIMGYSEEPLVSVDFRKDNRSSIIDALSTMVIEGDLVKVVAWYDNEWGYSSRIVDLIEYIIRKGI